MRKTIVLLLAIAASSALVPSVSAAGGAPSGASSFTLAGKITSIDASSETITVQVQSGNFLVKPYLGKSVTLTASQDTRFLLKTASTTVPITFADLQVGQSVSASGVLSDGEWLLARVTVGAELIHW
ncbi:MAG: DUF5666 domain-containing protein [Chloroflexi bacterium]|nr:DUF5666 domain-containing protein [Chloroflexota bacterium]